MVEPAVVVDVKCGHIDPTEFPGAGEPPNAPLEVQREGRLEPVCVTRLLGFALMSGQEDLGRTRMGTVPGSVEVVHDGEPVYNCKWKKCPLDRVPFDQNKVGRKHQYRICEDLVFRLAVEDDGPVLQSRVLKLRVDLPAAVQDGAEETIVRSCSSNCRLGRALEGRQDASSCDHTTAWRTAKAKGNKLPGPRSGHSRLPQSLEFQGASENGGHAAHDIWRMRR